VESRARNVPPDQEIFRSEILPGIGDVSLGQMVNATGLKKRYCSRVRKGECVPHPRHWEALLSLIISR
jgi:hypothetical protein